MAYLSASFFTVWKLYLLSNQVTSKRIRDTKKDTNLYAVMQPCETMVLDFFRSQTVQKCRNYKNILEIRYSKLSKMAINYENCPNKLCISLFNL